MNYFSCALLQSLVSENTFRSSSGNNIIIDSIRKIHYCIISTINFTIEMKA